MLAMAALGIVEHAWDCFMNERCTSSDELGAPHELLKLTDRIVQIQEVTAWILFMPNH